MLKTMASLEDEYVSHLFVAIINLMQFVCLKSELGKHGGGKGLFEDFAKSLDRQGREQALLNCLAVPDDNVRLAVVKCLYVVPLDQFDEKEIEQIVKTISQCGDISEGQTELVLSTVYWICCKLVEKQSQQKESSMIFIDQHG